MSEEVKKVKVKPYPISAVLLGGDKPVRCRIIRLTLVGAIIDMGRTIMHLNDRFTVEFELPAFHTPLKLEAKVVKTQDRLVEKKDDLTKRAVGVEVMRMSEFHFLKLTESDSSHVQNFLRTIRQIR